MRPQPLLGFHDGAQDLTDPAFYRDALAPFPDGRMLPRSAYRVKAFADLEDEKIWTRRWICVGHASAIPNTGDLLPFTVGNHGIHVRRDEDGGLSAWFNFAQHGGCRFVPRQCQTGRKTSCFYTSCGHSRDRDVLRAEADGSDTTEMYMYRGINPLKLLPVRLYTIGSLLFVNLDATAALPQAFPEIVESLLRRLFEPNRPSVGRFQVDNAANWKLRFRDAIAAGHATASTHVEQPPHGAVFWARSIRTNDATIAVTHGLSALESIGAPGTSTIAGFLPNLLVRVEDGLVVTTLLKSVGLTETSETSDVFRLDADATPADEELLVRGRALVQREAAATARFQVDLAGAENPSPFLPQRVDAEPSPPETDPLALDFQHRLIDCLLERHEYVDRPLFSNPGRALNAGVNSGTF
ncbi:MAG: hypothetical protein KIT73_00130 [Burkholderiales bacterium]|nr:hypothetical protein [Burkholderiales bacterium]